MKRKILFVIDTLEVGGTEISLVETVHLFNKIEPIVCHIYLGDTLKNRLTEKGIKVYSLNIHENFGFYKAYKSLRHIINTEKPHLIVPYLFRSELVSRIAGKTTKTPVIGTFVNDMPDEHNSKKHGLKSIAKQNISRLINIVTARVCIGFLSNSDSIAAKNSKYLKIPTSRVSTINRGRNNAKILIRDLNKKDDSISFLNIGRLVPEKGQKYLIEGFKLFHAVHPNSTLTIAGDGPEKNHLSELIRTLHLEKHVTLLGTVEPISDILHQHDCLISSTLSEGFSGALVEAAFAKLPILATRIPPNEEIVTHLDTGYLFEPRSAEAIANAMVWFKENREVAENFSETIYAIAIEKYSLEKIANKLEDYFIGLTSA